MSYVDNDDNKTEAVIKNLTRPPTDMSIADDKETVVGDYKNQVTLDGSMRNIYGFGYEPKTTKATDHPKNQLLE